MLQLLGGQSGAKAVRMLKGTGLDTRCYAAKSFAVACKRCNQLEQHRPIGDQADKPADGQQPDEEDQDPGEFVDEIPPEVGFTLTDVCCAVSEILAVNQADRYTYGRVVPAWGWCLEVICSEGHQVLCITLLMPIAGLNLGIIKYCMVTSPQVSKA